MAKRKQIGKYIFLIGLCLAVIWALKIYTPLFSTVVFEDYLTYDDRENAPFEYEDNYLVPFRNSITFSNRNWELSNPSDPQCQANSCDGVEDGLDSYGCMKYKRAYTVTSYYTTGCGRGCGRDAPISKRCCTYAPCKSWDYTCRKSSTAYETCGGALLGTCVGDGCFIQGTCSGNSYNNANGRWTTTQPIQTLKAYKEHYGNYSEGISIVTSTSSNTCSNGPSSVQHGTRYIDEYWDIYLSSGNAPRNDGFKGDYIAPTISNGKITLKGSSNKYSNSRGDWSGTANPYLMMKSIKNFQGYDLKLVIYCGGGYSYSGGSSGATRYVAPVCTFKFGTKSFNIPEKTTKVIEIFSSKFDSNVADVFIGGLFSETINITGEKQVEFTATGGSPHMEIKYFGYQIPFSCVQGPEELLGIETFNGGTEGRKLSLYSTRYGVTKFCLAHPAIITRESESGSTTTAEIYQRLARGEVMDIPAGDTWTLFYIFYNDGSISAVCDLDEVYDFERNKCTNLTGVAFICSEGVFDPALGTCVVTPEVKEVCEVGRYDVAQNACIYNPPIQAVCTIGNYNSVTGKCEYHPDQSNICDEGYDYNSFTQMCEKYPEAVILCEPSFTFNPISGLCEKEIDSVYLCDGEFNETTKICTKTIVPNIKRVCSEEDMSLYQDSNDNYFCVYTPEVKEVCLQGSYDSDLNACVFKPNLKYLCINGDVSSDNTHCLIYPESKIVCPDGFKYDMSSKTCIMTPENLIFKQDPIMILFVFLISVTLIGLIMILMRK
jgi:hypothetical protein